MITLMAVYLRASNWKKHMLIFICIYIYRATAKLLFFSFWNKEQIEIGYLDSQ